HSGESGLGIFGSLIGGGGEVRVAESAFSAGEPDYFLAVFVDLGFLGAGFFIAGDFAKRHFDYNIFSEAAGLTISAPVFAVFGQYIFEVSEVEQGPEVAVAFEDDVSAAAAVATIGATEGGEFISHEVFAAWSAVSASAEDPDLVNKIALFQIRKFVEQR